MSEDYLEPTADRASDHFWQALADRRLEIQRCWVCARHVFYPRVICSYCQSEDLRWVRASGRGVVYSHTTVHRASGLYAGETPYVVAIVDLDEGVRLLARLDGVDPGAPVIDLPVRAVFTEYRDRTAVRFMPVATP